MARAEITVHAPSTEGICQIPDIAARLEAQLSDLHRPEPVVKDISSFAVRSRVTGHGKSCSVGELRCQEDLKRSWVSRQGLRVSHTHTHTHNTQGTQDTGQYSTQTALHVHALEPKHQRKKTKQLGA